MPPASSLAGGYQRCRFSLAHLGSHGHRRRTRRGGGRLGCAAGSYSGRKPGRSQWAVSAGCGTRQRWRLRWRRRRLGEGCSSCTERRTVTGSGCETGSGPRQSLSGAPQCGGLSLAGTAGRSRASWPDAGCSAEQARRPGAW